MDSISSLVDKIATVLINPLLLLLFAVGLLVFIFGIVEFLVNLNKSGKSVGIDSGRKHMFWGLVGMFVMVAAYAIVGIIVNTFPLPGAPTSLCPGNLPPGPGGVCSGGI